MLCTHVYCLLDRAGDIRERSGWRTLPILFLPRIIVAVRNTRPVVSSGWNGLVACHRELPLIPENENSVVVLVEILQVERAMAVEYENTCPRDVVETCRRGGGGSVSERTPNRSATACQRIAQPGCGTHRGGP